MKVSVIIINYNTFQLTCRCIEAVKQKCTTQEIEIILVDNASTEVDANQFLEIFPDVRLVKANTNLGFAKGNNLGISVATGQYILLLNSDAFLLNDAITPCINFLSSHPLVAVVTGRLQYPDGRVQNNCQRFPSIWVILFEKLRLQKILPKHVGGKILMGSFFSHNEIAYPDWVWGTFFMFRKADINNLPKGKLADDFFMYGEDMQWCMDFKLTGVQVAFIPEARMIHLVGASGSLKDDLIKKNEKLFLEMYYPRWHGWLLSLVR